MPKISRKFLLIFSTCSLAVAGLVYACGDGGWDADDNSSFSPQAFVAPEYSPFFYISYKSYYGNDVDNGNRFNHSVVAEWEGWFKNRIDSVTLDALLLRSTAAGVDSASLYVKGKLNVAPAGSGHLEQFKSDKKKANLFFNYLSLAKAAESYALVPGDQYWYSSDDDARKVDPVLEQQILKELKRVKDPFVKQRLWFQLVRYYYFVNRLDQEQYTQKGYDLPAYFAATEGTFPKNMIYYRSLGYLAGYYYSRNEFSEANYLYSKGYDYAAGLKLPNQWSFHPQEEQDWKATLALAKTTEEKVTLWHMLGTTQDELRAIQAIYTLDPATEKLDLLLSRLINKRELNGAAVEDKSENGMAIRRAALHELKVVNTIADGNKVHQPVLWKMGAGYLNALAGDYSAARKFYDAAKKLLPADNQLLQAQYRLLDWSLYVSKLKKIDIKAEQEMAGYLNWLADLSEEKEVIADLRYSRALGETLTTLANLYAKQHEPVKANCFRPSPDFYLRNIQVNALKALMLKTNPSAFEKAMLRFYPVKPEQLNYFQASQLVYRDQPEKAIALMEQAGESASLVFQGNPFNMRLLDCHDCDHEQVLKTPFTALSFIKTLVKIKAELTAGKDVSRNAALLANAYYNISYYGNARLFYQSDMTGSYGNYPQSLSPAFRGVFTSNQLAEQYYLLAKAKTASVELKARYTFMASKCEHNAAYNRVYMDPSHQNRYYGYEELLNIPDGRQYASLKNEFENTAFYQEIIRECGYFRTYLSKPAEVDE